MKSAFAAAVVVLAFCVAPLLSGREVPKPDDTETITAEELETKGEIEVAPALSLYRPDVFSTVDGSVLIHSLPVLTLLDGRRFPISTELGRMGFTTLDFVPLAFLTAVDVQKNGASPRYGSDAPGGVVDLRLNRYFSGAEIGVFYGKSGGKYGREDFQTYFLGGVGNDKFHITVGAAYQESEGRIHYRGP